jgi:pimeloyl-ACP methyl ester carboxylesterase
MKNIILLHGALGFEGDLDRLAIALSSKGVQVHQFNFTGHGNEAFSQNFGISQFVDELQTFIRANKLIKPAVFGYSMGGYVALKLASIHCEIMGKVITLATKFDWSPKVIARESGMCDKEFLQDKAASFFARLQKNHREWEKLLVRTGEMITNFATENVLDDKVLKSITTPVLLGLGDNDKMVTVEETLVVRKHISQSAMYMLPNTKHPLESVPVKLLTEVIVDFIK